jgi:hypothetical protein
MTTRARGVKERRDKVADVVHSGRLEGREPSPEFLADAEKYVRGQVSASDVVKSTRKRYGLD